MHLNLCNATLHVKVTFYPHHLLHPLGHPTRWDNMTNIRQLYPHPRVGCFIWDGIQSLARPRSGSHLCEKLLAAGLPSTRPSSQQMFLPKTIGMLISSRLHRLVKLLTSWLHILATFSRTGILPGSLPSSLRFVHLFPRQ